MGWGQEKGSETERAMRRALHAADVLMNEVERHKRQPTTGNADRVAEAVDAYREARDKT